MKLLISGANINVTEVLSNLVRASKKKKRKIAVQNQRQLPDLTQHLNIKFPFKGFKTGFQGQVKSNQLQQIEETTK